MVPGKNPTSQVCSGNGHPLGHEVEEFDEGYSGQTDVYIIAEDSIVEIGNTIEFNRGVVILPDKNKQTSKTAEHMLNGLQSGELKPKNIGEELTRTGDSYCFTKTRWVFLGVLGTIIIVIFVIIPFTSPSLDKECNVTVSRKDWEAAHSKCPIPQFERPPRLVLVYQTEKDVCKSCKECADQVRSLQYFQQNPRSIRATVRPSPACDIQYNFLVGGDGRIYEGRGYTSRSGMPDSFEHRTFILVFMGLFVLRHPEDKQLSSAEMFLKDAVKKGYLDPNFKVAGAMQVRRSVSPGCALLGDLQLWEWWTEKPLKLLNTTRTRNETFADLCNQLPPTE